MNDIIAGIEHCFKDITDFIRTDIADSFGDMNIILNNENNIRSIDEKASVTNSIAQKLNTLTRSNAQTAAQINDVVEKFN